MPARIDAQFFNRDTKQVAIDLLGKRLVRMQNGGREELIINETEAYLGQADKACHAHKGRTDRTEVMFGPPGMLYVYLIYGMYHMLNIITKQEGEPEGVLIRGAGEHDGPGKLTQHLDVDMSFDAKPAVPDTGLWIEEGVHCKESDIVTTSRIGVGYADEWAKKDLRFVFDSEARTAGSGG